MSDLFIRPEFRPTPTGPVGAPLKAGLWKGLEKAGEHGCDHFHGGGGIKLFCEKESEKSRLLEKGCGEKSLLMEKDCSCHEKHHHEKGCHSEKQGLEKASWEKGRDYFEKQSIEKGSEKQRLEKGVELAEKQAIEKGSEKQRLEKGVELAEKQAIEKGSEKRREKIETEKQPVEKLGDKQFLEKGLGPGEKHAPEKQREKHIMIAEKDLGEKSRISEKSVEKFAPEKFWSEKCRCEKDLEVYPLESQLVGSAPSSRFFI
ncbi:MAG TPA: hypothetical protein VNO81_09915 [Candidatus Nitrosotenuis sp.]|jgi:hypothetical protein|nr:hypothetical protein [Candidatus Nitrosotenuis sp.]